MIIHKTIAERKIEVVHEYTSEVFTEEELINLGKLIIKRRTLEKADFIFQDLNGYKLTLTGDWGGTDVVYKVGVKGNNIIVIEKAHSLSLKLEDYTPWEKNTYLRVTDSVNVCITGDSDVDLKSSDIEGSIRVEVGKSSRVTFENLYIKAMQSDKWGSITLEKVNIRSLNFTVESNGLVVIKNSRITTLTEPVGVDIYNSEVVRMRIEEFYPYLNTERRGSKIRELEIGIRKNLYSFSHCTHPLYAVQISAFGTYNGIVTFFPNFNLVFAGCWSGTLEEFEERLELIVEEFSGNKRIEANIYVVDYFKIIRKSSFHMLDSYEVELFKKTELRKINGIQLDFDYFNNNLNKIL